MTEPANIGKYKVTGSLGQGSFGVVYQGYDPDIRREVAIKVCAVDDLDLRRRFAREARISGNLQHKNIVTVFAAETDDQGVPYLVQEFLTGEDLRELIRRREPIPSYRKIDYLLQVARGLAHAHAHGVIHRDVKPANVRLLADGAVKIMDFGIAKLASAETQLTQKGVTLGTASYLPPEQVRGGDLDHRADIFSFGVLTYELLTYERPFRGHTLSSLVYQILYKVPAPMIAVWPECPESLSDLVAKCLEKKPEDRYASMEELIPELARIAEEIEAGKWPALRGVSTAQTLLPETRDDTGVMSQSEISRTARAVEQSEGELAANAQTQVTRLREVSLEETQAILEAALAEAAAAPSGPPAEPSAASRLDASTEVLPQDELADRARQIGALIEKGDLEAAKAQLEETLTEQREGPADEISQAPPPRATSSADRRTLVRTAADRDAESAPSDSYQTAILSWAPWLRWAALAALAAGLVVVGWIMLRPGPEPPPGPTAATEPMVPQPVPTGAVTIAALPWAEVREITDARGFVQPLPPDPFTPLRLELPPGTYRIELRHPDHEGRSCEVEVVAGLVAPCEVELARPTLVEYFKESGWWR